MTTIDVEARQSVLDEEHLRLLGLGYLLSGILTAGFSLFGLFYAFMGVVFLRAVGEFPSQAGAPPPDLGWFFGVFGVAFFLLMATGAALDIATYRCLRRRQARTFCLIIAGLNCLGVPYGTALGVCTFLVMNRPSVEKLFAAPPAAGPV